MHSLKQNYSVCQITEGLLFLQYKCGGAKAREKEECKRGNKHLESISAQKGDGGAAEWGKQKGRGKNRAR